MAERVERRLAAILAVDVVGYSRLMGADEEGTLAALKAIRRELVDPRIVEHRGRIDRPRLSPQHEFLPRLAQQGRAQVMGRPTRHCDQPFRRLAAPQPARPRRPVAHCHRLCVFFKSEVR